MTGSEPTLREALALALEMRDVDRGGSPHITPGNRFYLDAADDLIAYFPPNVPALPPAARAAEHEALRDRMLAWAHVYLAAVATGSPEAYQRECWQALVEARDALDAYLDAHPALLAKYKALWGAIEAKG